MATQNVTQRGRMFPTRHDLPEERRQELVQLLNAELADLQDLYTQTKHAHWNVKGANFYGTHKMFDEVAAMVLPLVDEVAERVTALGGTALGTVRMAAENSRLDDFPADVHQTLDVIAVVADRYAAAARLTREGIDQSDELGDKDTADLFTEVSRALDQALYFLEAHLQK